ncbi:Serine/threonine-protein kinase PrkC [Calidithermus terrae]|uniref:Serine/threonine-protein kinase PrkC n=1 Tax=Calidithermus terrae TaxID=1408545 RepID=A0A399E9A7_9DEIN|nr:Serine/threonine-protein kinase PrkC [Calidithermus terrae]
MFVGLPGATLLGRYRVIRPIARGAVATVYLAFDLHGTPYALKVFPKGYESRADREWKVGGALQHPRINPVYQRLDLEDQAASSENGPAVLIAYAPGERFNDWRSRRPEMVLRVFEQLLEGLAHMHQQGYVHRDIKPENVVVDGTGEARLVDFDLAGPAGERLPKQFLVGTPAYMAPELFLGQTTSPASDVYAAGIFLYWSLSNELPFFGSTEEVMEAHLKHAVPVPTPTADTRLQVTAPLLEFIYTMLAKDPAERFGSGAEALEAFRGLNAGGR